MALVHEKLYQSRDLAQIDFAEYVRNLSDHLLHSYGTLGAKITLKIDAREIFFDVNIAVPCGLIINELITNSLKYAFPVNFHQNPVIQIELKKVEDRILEALLEERWRHGGWLDSRQPTSVPTWEECV